MNIQAVLSELNKKMTDSQIGAEINASQATVCRLRNGIHKKTDYKRGMAIKALAIREGVAIHDNT